MEREEINLVLIDDSFVVGRECGRISSYSDYLFVAGETVWKINFSCLQYLVL